MMAALGIALATLAVLWWTTPQTITPDGRFYQLAQSGSPVPRPYCFRVVARVVPVTSGEKSWRVLTAASLVVTALAMSAYSGGSWVAVALLMALPGVSLVAWRFPVLVDAPAYALALVAAALVVSGHPVAGALVAVASGACKESAPVFAALWAWSPWPLVGLVVPLAVLLLVRPGEIPTWAREWLSNPLKSARGYHAEHALDGRAMLAPWGVCLAALFAPVTASLAASVAVAYGQLVTANDRVRLIQWAAPPVAVAASVAVPEPLVVAAVAAHVFNPWKGTGV